MRKLKVPSVLISAVLSTSLTLLSSQVAVHAASRFATGPTGQTLSVSKTTNLNSGDIVTAKGSRYDTKHGIYVAFCVVPPKNTKPDECYGGINMSGKSAGSVWISSNPPLYGKLLAQKYGANGSFSVWVKVNRYIGSKDCKKVKCAVLTRADHTNSDFRKADVIVPVTFK